MFDVRYGIYIYVFCSHVCLFKALYVYVRTHMYVLLLVHVPSRLVGKTSSMQEVPLCIASGQIWSARLSCSALQCIATCCSVMQCYAVCCSVLQCVAVAKAHVMSSLAGLSFCKSATDSQVALLGEEKRDNCRVNMPWVFATATHCNTPQHTATHCN